MKQFLIVLLIIIIAIVAWMFLKKAPATTTTVSPTETTPAPSEQAPSAQDMDSQMNVGASASVQGTVSTPATQNGTVTIANFAFAPATITVTAGSTVTWKQEDSAPHSIVADDNSYSSATLSSGQTYSHTYTKPGTYTYHCGIHPMMKGTVVVK